MPFKYRMFSSSRSVNEILTQYVELYLCSNWRLSYVVVCHADVDSLVGATNGAQKQSLSSLAQPAGGEVLAMLKSRIYYEFTICKRDEEKCYTTDSVPGIVCPRVNAFAVEIYLT